MARLKLGAYLKKPDLKNKKFYAVLLAVAVVLIGWLAFGDKLHKPGEKVYAEVAGHKIYKSEIDDLIGKRKINLHDAAQVLADKYLVQELAKEQGISIGDQDIEKEYKTKYGKVPKDYKTKNKYAYQQDVNQLYLTKLRAYNNGIYKGKLLIANFSRHVAFQPTLPEDELSDPKLGNPTAIAKDKEYAKNLITKLRNDVESGKITFDEAINIEHNDPEVGEHAYPTVAHSRSFDTSYFTDSILSVDSIKEKVSKIKSGELTEPFVVKVPNSFDGKSTAESYFLVIKMDESSGGSGMNFQEYIDNAKERLGYKLYV